jgi:hypothetical protein
MPWPPARGSARPLRGEGKRQPGRCPSGEPTPAGPAEAGPAVRLIGQTRRKSRGQAATAALHATPTCTGPGFRRNQSWPGWSVFQDCREVQRAFRGRLAETGSSIWDEDVAGYPVGRFRGSSPQRDDNASSLGRGDRPASHPKERRRKGPRPRQARVKGIEVCLVSEETGRPTITETRRGYKPAVPVPATPPEGEEARHTQQQARDRRQSWRGKHLRRSASPALTTNDRPRAATTRCRNP